MNLSELPISLRDSFAQTPEVLGGKLRLPGTRISVEQVLELLAAGVLPEEIVQSFPSLTEQDVASVEGLIETEAENERLLAIVEKMMHRDLSLEEERLFNLLVKLIEDFEARQYPMGESAPHELLQFLLEQRGLRQRDIVPLLGSSGVASEVINGKRAISKAQAKKLAEFFHVSVEVFV